MAEENINLMPEDLRQKELKSLEKKTVPSQPDLSVPNVSEKNTNQAKVSGGDNSWMTSFAERLHNKQNPKTAESFKPLEVNSEQAETVTVTQEKTPTTPIMETAATQAPVQAVRTNGFELGENASAKVEGQFHQPEKNIRARFIDNAEGVDLVPSSAKIKSFRQISVLILTAFIASLGVLVVFYFGLLTLNTSFSSNQNNTISNISEIENKLLEFEDISNQINKVGKDINLIYDALNKHVYWTNLFTLLEKYTLADVYYSGFAANSGGALTLNASAPSYYAVAKQLKILQSPEAQEFVTDVNISAATLTELGVSFSVSLTLNPNLFYYQAAE